MSYAQKNIIEAYSRLFEGLNALSKIELIEKLSKLLKKETKTNEIAFYESFGAFASEEKPEDIIRKIRSSRKFKNREINF